MATINLNLVDSEGRKYGYVDYPWSNQSNCKFRVKITELNVDTVNLKTKFRVQLYAYRDDGYDTYSISSQNVVSLRLTSHNGSSFDGQTYTANPSNLHVNSNTKNTVLLTHDYNAAHDSSGKLSIGLTAYINLYYGGYKTGTTTTTCNSFTAIDVSKGSTFTVNNTNVYVNGSNTISGTITRGRWSGVAMTKHKITISVGEKTTTKDITVNSDSATNYSIAVPKTFLDQTAFRSSKYYNGYISISAIDSSGTEHSSGTKAIKFYVPSYSISTDDVTSAINNSLQLVYTNPSLTSATSWYGKIIQNITKLKVNVNCSDILNLINYAYIKKIELHTGSSTVSVTNPTSANTYVLISNIISSTDTSATDWYVTVTDTRGVSGTSKVNNAGKVIKYSPPKITNLTASRCTSDGTITESGKYAKLNVEATCSVYEDGSIDNKSTLYYSVLKNKLDTITTSNNLFNKNAIIEGYVKNSVNMVANPDYFITGTIPVVPSKGSLFCGVAKDDNTLAAQNFRFACFTLDDGTVKYSNNVSVVEIPSNAVSFNGTFSNSVKDKKIYIGYGTTCEGVTYEDESTVKNQDSKFSDYEILNDDTIIEIGEYSTTIRVKIEDTLSSTEASVDIPASSNMKPLLDFIKGGKGVAIGKIAEEEDTLDLTAYNKTKVKKYLDVYDEDSLYAELHLGLNEVKSSSPVYATFRLGTLNLVELSETSSIYSVSIGALTRGLASSKKNATLTIGDNCKDLWLNGTSVKRNFSNDKGTGSNLVWDSSSNKIMVSSSAAKYKTDIEYIDNTDEYHEMFEKMKPVSYRYKSSEDKDDTNIGFIADDIAKINPKLALYSNEGEVENYRDRDMFALLFMEVQRQNKIIKELQTEISDLKNEINKTK